MYSWALRPLLFALPPDWAHAAALAGLAPVERFGPLRAAVQAILAPDRDERLTVHTMGLEFAHPLGIAGGFDKNACCPRALAALGFAHLEIGTVTAQPQPGNPKPNLFRLPLDRALLNRLGFPNAGAVAVAERLRTARRKAGAPSGAPMPAPIGVSIGKSRVVPVDDLDAVVADYVSSFDAVRDVADFVVVNVSSPNTAGLRTMQSEDHARALLTTLSSRAHGRPLLVKVAPDLDEAQLETLLAVVDEVHLAGIVATNTTTSRAGLATGADHVQALGAGGVSGPPLRARALEVVRRARARLGRAATIVGVGGIEAAEHAMAFVRAGADLVQMYTGFVYEGPAVSGRIARELASMVEAQGKRRIGELVGGAEGRAAEVS